MKKEDFDKKLEAFRLRLDSAKDTTPDALKADLDSLMKDAASYHTAEKYDGIDTLLSAKGLKKPEGVKTLDFIQTVAQSANEAATLKTEIETLKADKGKAPDVAKLKSEFEGTINTLKDQLAQTEAKHAKELRTTSIKSKVDAIQFAESFKSAESYVKDALTAKLSGFYYETVDGKQYIKNGNTFLVDNGKMVSLEDFISKETATFVKQEKQTTLPPASPKGGSGTGQTVTYEQKAAFIQANNIDIKTAEGQAALAAAFPEAK